MIIIEPKLVESDGSIHQIVERWKAGEVVEEITDTYQGGEVDVVLIAECRIRLLEQCDPGQSC